MVDQYEEIYVKNYEAGAINAGANEIFGGDQTFSQVRDRHGSANSFIITNLAAEDFEILLDNTYSVGICYARGGLVLKPSEGRFFNTIQAINRSATNSSASELKVRIARANLKVVR